VRRHHDAFMTSHGSRKELCQKREDITLIVRNVNCAVPNAIGLLTAPGRQGSAGLPLTILIPTPQRGVEAEDASPEDRAFFRPNINELNERQRFNNGAVTLSSSTSTTLDSSTTSVADHRPFDPRNTSSAGQEAHMAALQLDADGKVGAYIDFEEYYRAVAALNDAQRLVLSTELEPKGGYETIKEERESTCSTPGGST